MRPILLLMGIKERKVRHKEDLKQRILEAAISLFIKDGYDATSMRKIAAKVEFSPTTIYLYYKDKSDIMYALHLEGFRLLHERFTALAEVDHPFERLKAMGRAYIKFAHEKRAFYELMFVMKEPLTFLDLHCSNENREWKEGIQVFMSLQHTVEQCQAVGYFKGQDSKDFSLLVWSAVHGMCTLSIHGHLDHMVKHEQLCTSSEQALQQSFEALVKLLSSMQ